MSLLDRAAEATRRSMEATAASRDAERKQAVEALDRKASMLDRLLTPEAQAAARRVLELDQATPLLMTPKRVPGEPNWYDWVWLFQIEGLTFAIRLQSGLGNAIRDHAIRFDGEPIGCFDDKLELIGERGVTTIRSLADLDASMKDRSWDGADAFHHGERNRILGEDKKWLVCPYENHPDNHGL
jgi:hypothetical protein